MFTTDERMIAGVKAMYPAGTKIVLDSMGDDPRPIPPGTKGTVVHVDDIGTVLKLSIHLRKLFALSVTKKENSMGVLLTELFMARTRKYWM